MKRSSSHFAIKLFTEGVEKRIEIFLASPNLRQLGGSAITGDIYRRKICRVAPEAGGTQVNSCEIHLGTYRRFQL